MIILNIEGESSQSSQVPTLTTLSARLCSLILYYIITNGWYDTNIKLYTVIRLVIAEHLPPVE